MAGGRKVKSWLFIYAAGRINIIANLRQQRHGGVTCAALLDFPYDYTPWVSCGDIGSC